MNLKDTTEMMVSKDYKERFKAEYSQLWIRLIGLKEMLRKWDKKELDFKPTCPRSIYDMQVQVMVDYLATLEERAEIEEVNLEELNL